MASNVNGSFASPLADAQHPLDFPFLSGGLVSRLYNGTNGLNIFGLFVTAFLILVAYDQCKAQIATLHAKPNMLTVVTQSNMSRIKAQSLGRH